MAATNLDDVVAMLAGGQKKIFTKQSGTAEAIGVYHSLWKLNGNPPAGSNAGGTPVVPTDATTGAIPFTNPTGGDTTYLAMVSASNTVAGTLIILDRLAHVSGLSGTVTSPTTTGTWPSLTRPDANGADTELWVEINTAIGSSATTLTVTYTDQDGNAGSATLANPLPGGSGAPIANACYPFPLAAGDTGVRACGNYNWNTTTGTAGDFGLVIARRIAEIPIPGIGLSNALDFASLGLPIIYDDACLWFVFQPTSSAASGLLQGHLILGQT